MTTTAPNTQTPWYAPGLSFECTQCGNCCTGPPGYVWFNPDEARAIAAYLGLSEDEFRRRYAAKKSGRWTLEEVRTESGYDCVFLRRDEQGKAWCRVYPVRPTQCRTWPFWDSNLRSPRDWAEAAETCPGMRSGKNFVPVERIRVIAESNPKGL